MAQSFLYTNNKKTPDFGAVKNANLSNYAAPVPTATTVPTTTPQQAPQATTPVNNDYFLRPGETPQQYLARTQGVPSPTIPSTITADTLQGTTPPITIPTYNPPPPPAPDLSELIKAFNTPTDAESQAQNQQTDILRGIEGLLGQQGNEGARTAQLETEAGIPNLSKQLNEINAQIRGINASAFSQTQEAENRLAPTFQIYGQQAQIARQQSAQTFGLAAASAALQDNIALATQNVDRAIEAEFGGIESQLKYQELLLNLNRDNLTTAQEKKAQGLEIALNERSRLLEEEKTNRQGVYDVFLQAAQNKADNLTLQRIQQARTPEEATEIAADSGFLITPEDPTKLQFVSGTDNQRSGYFNPETGEFVPTGGGGGGGAGAPNLAGLTDEQKADPFVQLLLSTAGGKPITDTFAQSLNKGLNVLGQIGALQTNIQDTNTGPLVGLFRDANPWDTNAQTIKAQLNAIVPNLARGVYGEVGVLTDNDITQYSKTLPNLKSTEDIRNAVLGITVDMVGKSIKRILEVNAANQKDVSGFVDIYTEMLATRDSIFSQIPGYKGPGATDETLDVEQETTEDTFSSSGSVNESTKLKSIGEAGGFWNWLFQKR